MTPRGSTRDAAAAVGSVEDQAASSTPFGPECLVVLRAPRALAGTRGVVRRVLGTEREVEFRSPLGTPMHIVVPAKRLVPAPQADARPNTSNAD